MQKLNVLTATPATLALATYAAKRRRLPLPHGETSAFLVTRTGHRLSYEQANRLFGRVRRYAHVQREAQARYQPRLHDLRHTAISSFSALGLKSWSSSTGSR